MTAPHKKPGVAFWATVVVVGLPLLYVVSFGPVCWITSYSGIRSRLLPLIYRPMTWTFGDQTSRRGRAAEVPPLGRLVQNYADLGAPRTWGWVLTFTSDGSYYWEWLEWDVSELPLPGR